MLFFFGLIKDEKYYLRSLGEDPRKVRILNVKLSNLSTIKESILLILQTAIQLIKYNLK